MKKKKNLPADNSPNAITIRTPDEATLAAMSPEDRNRASLVLAGDFPVKFKGRIPTNAAGETDLLTIGAVLEITGTTDTNAAIAVIDAAAAGQYIENCPDGDRSRALAQLAALKPEDHLQAMLCSQMVAINSAITKTMVRATSLNQTPAGIDANLARATKLQRTFLQQIDTLQRLRGKGQQTVEVKHVHIHDGAQAIIGPVTHTGGEG